MSEPPEGRLEDVTALVDRNGLVALFANRVRARVLVTLFYAGDPLTAAAIAEHAETRIWEVGGPARVLDPDEALF